MTMPTVNLDTLPAPQALVEANEVAMFAKLIADIQSVAHLWQPRETDPLYQGAESMAAYGFALLSFLNNRSISLFLPQMSGADLDNLAALFDIERGTRDDAQLRNAIMTEPRARIVVGTEDAIEYFTTQASDAIIDVSLDVQSNRDVWVYILVNDSITPPATLLMGVPSDALRTAVQTYINNRSRKSIIDNYIVQRPTVTRFYGAVSVVLLAGVNPTTTTLQINTDLQDFLTANFRLNRRVARSDITTLISNIDEVDTVDLTRLTLDNTVMTRPTADIAAVEHTAFRTDLGTDFIVTIT